MVVATGHRCPYITKSHSYLKETQQSVHSEGETCVCREIKWTCLQTMSHTLCLKPSTMLTKRKSVFLGLPFNHTLSRNSQVNGSFRVMDGSPRDVSEALQKNTPRNLQKQITGMMVSPSVVHLWKFTAFCQNKNNYHFLLCKHIFIGTLFQFAFCCCDKQHSDQRQLAKGR